MSDVILKIENVSKQYRLGTVGTGTISHDLNRWWHAIRGKEDPFLKIGETNDRATKGESDYVWALKDINFEVKRGEVLGIIGKNGAGKSTLLKILSKVTGPTTGSIKFNGRIASLLEVGTGFHPELTGKENVYLNGAILGMTKAEISAKYDEIIAFSGCERYIDTPVKRYSSGMKVRLAFAVAAHLEPDILIVDEVLAVGDAEFQKKAIGKMQDISAEGGRTVLFVSHDMEAVKQLCSIVLVLKNGQIEFQGEVNKGVDLYLNYSFKQVTLPKRYYDIISLDKTSINIGDSIIIQFSKKIKKIDKFSLGLTIRDENEKVLFGANTIQYDKVFDRPGDIIDIEIENINLNPGRYWIDLYLGTGKFDDEIIEKALWFDVNWSKLFAAPKKHWGNIHFDVNWNI